MKQKNLLAKNADPYDVVIYASRLFKISGAEEAIKFIEEVLPIRKSRLEDYKSKIENLLDDTKEYTGKIDRTIELKRYQTKLDNEVVHLNQLIEFYSKISNKPIEDVGIIKK